MTKKEHGPTDAETKKRHEREAEGGAAGAIAGAAIGTVAGPAGAAVGAVLGAVAGALTGAVGEEEASSQDAEDRKLDHELGVSGGEIGAKIVKHPPAKVGAYSGDSAGAGSSEEEESAEGPMQTPK